MIHVDREILEQIARERRFGAQTLQIATRLFVQKVPPRRVALEFGLIVQRVYAIRKEILKAAEAHQLPAEWARSQLVGPRHLVEHFERLFAAALSAEQGDVTSD